ncbi:MAG: DUF669 domain-containing protein [Anaerohalosphaeraceae bacterium]|nr:DUF669 domain-containing protein [Anaerohalosphaeraceae bacterium]
MADLGNFNANEVEPTSAFEPLPAGKYIATITASEMKPTKKGDGSYLELEFTVLEGNCQGRKTWDRLCINHPKDLTQKIAKGCLSAICRAVGVLQPGDSVELHNLPLEINVKCKKSKDTGDIFNEIRGYAAKSRPQTQPVQQPAQQSQPVQPPAGAPQAQAGVSPQTAAPGNAPWQR